MFGMLPTFNTLIENICLTFLNLFIILIHHIANNSITFFPLFETIRINGAACFLSDIA